MTRMPSRARGFTLIELTISMLIGAIVLGGLTSVIFVAFAAQTSGKTANEQIYSAGFALERVVLKTRAAPLKPIAPVAAGTTGNWLAPLAFCLSGRRLVETTDTDTTCSGGITVADDVSAFSAEIPPGARVLDAPVIVYTLTFAPSGAPRPITLAASVRLGGGTQ